MEFTLREARPEDAPALTAVHVRCWKQTYASMLPDGFFTEQYEASRLTQWQRVLTDPECRSVLAEDRAGNVVGLAMTAAPFGEHSTGLPVARQLYNLYVLSQAHGTGVGQALFDAVLGAQSAVLWVADQNARAIAFYRRNGFEMDGFTITDPKIPGLTEARMQRPATMS